MTTTTQHAPGMACWPELATTDHAAAKRFYGSLFGWDPQDNDIGPGQVYTTLKLKGHDVGALYGLSQEQRDQRIPPHWMNYIAVENADQTVEQARQRGATIIVEPMDVFEHGRMAVIKDPTGAVFSIWQAKQHPGAGIVNEPGSLVWTELYTPDPAKATAFYSGVFGYSTEPMPGMDYTILKKGGAQAAGLMKLPAELESRGVPPHWLTYFAVDDCDATAAKARELGGKILMPPDDIPNIGRFAVLQDPQNAVFAVIAIAPRG